MPIDVYVSGKDSTDVLTGKSEGRIERKGRTKYIYRFWERNLEAERRDSRRWDTTKTATIDFATIIIWRSLRLYFCYISKIEHGTCFLFCIRIAKIAFKRFRLFNIIKLDWSWKENTQSLLYIMLKKNQRCHEIFVLLWVILFLVLL